MAKRPTINDVARHAGVSIKTVSRVINQEPNVRSATQSRVRQVIEQLGYRPSMSARVLAGKRSYLVGLLYDNPSASYITNIQQGVLAVCRETSYDLLIHPCDYQSKTLREEIGQFLDQSRVDGVILTPPVSDLPSLRRYIKQKQVPCAFVAPGGRTVNDTSVATNDREVCAAMVAYLAELGHRDIGFILGHPDHLAIAHRHEGFLEGMKNAGLRTPQSLRLQGYNTFESGLECGRRLLGRKRRPTAIFASNDDMAAGVLRAAHDLELAIPGDLSVAGFDDIPLAGQIWPPLTTIRQPIEAMARAATRLLLRKVANQSADGIERRIESRLVIRESTGPAPKGRG
jgi:LacI family transcriptional regulator